MTRETAPALFIINPMNEMARHKYTAGSIVDLQISDIQNFINDFEKGKLPKFTRSEDEEPHHDGEV